MGKPVDLLLRFEAVQHRDFLLALADHAIAFNGNEVVIAHNALVGIEVECGDDPARSIANNLTKDRAAGLSCIVFAVMPKQVRTATQYLSRLDEKLDGIFVVDALQLLDALRSARKDAK